MHPWSFSRGRFPLLGANGIPVRTQKPELPEKVAIQSAEPVVAPSAHLIVIEKEKAIGISDHGSKLDLKRLMAHETLRNDVLSRLSKSLHAAEDAVQECAARLTDGAFIIGQQCGILFNPAR